MRKVTWGLALGATLACWAVGCGDDAPAGEATGSEIPEVGETKQALVTAAEGGELRLADFSLEVPAGAVRGDVTIKLEVQSTEGRPERDKLRGPVYELGPDGTRFDKPVKLELPIERLPREKERAEVVWLDEKNDRWTRLEGSQVTGGKVRAEVDHFTAFTVRFVVDGGGVQIDSGDLTCDTAFEACGGDLEGSWEFTDACTNETFGAGPAPQSGTDVSPVLKQTDCQATGEYTVNISGFIAFDRGDVMGTQFIETTSETRTPLSCFEPPVTCEEAGGVEEGDECVMRMQSPLDNFPLDGTYTTDGSQLILMLDADPTSAEQDIQYCVQGDTLTVVSRDSDGYEFRFTGARQ